MRIWNSLLLHRFIWIYLGKSKRYNIFEGLVECKGVLGKFGGHPMAAGMSLKEENVDALRTALNSNCKLTDADLIKIVKIDFLYYPSINEWNGNKNVQVIINSIR